MPIDSSYHACRTGAFYDTALSLSTRKLSFLTELTIGPFICICLGKSNIALLWFLSLGWYTKHNTTNIRNKNQTSTTKTLSVYSKFLPTPYTISFTATIIILIILSGDIHPNPGPNHSEAEPNTISIIHLNANRLKNKIPQIELRTKNIDIVTVSETWLTPKIQDDTIRLQGFHKPIRKDRNSEGGGVAIYIKEHLIIKPRPDLDVNNLEAVWVETKIDNNTLLIGSFYRPGSKPVSYWDLIDLSIANAART